MAHHAGGRPWSTSTNHAGVFLGFHATVPPYGMRKPQIASLGPLSVTGDIRIDNRSEVAAQLGLQEQPNDHELVLHAYQRWGRDAAKRLIGEFAIALWDSTRKVLWMARDAIGVRPVYFALVPGGVMAATEMNAFCFLEGVPKRISEAWMASRLRTEGSFVDIHPLDGVQALRQAQDVEIGPGGGEEPRTYWRPNPKAASAYRTRSACEARLRELMVEAVLCRSGPGVATQLSGGIDSSAIALLAAREREADNPLRAYGLVLPDDHDPNGVDERRHMETVVKAGNIQFSPVSSPASMIFEDHGRSPLAAEQEIGFMAEGPAKLAAQDGCTVLLSGYGGDEFASSHARGLVHSWVRKGRWIRVVRFARQRSLATGVPLWRTLVRIVRAARPRAEIIPDGWPSIQALVDKEFRARSRVDAAPRVYGKSAGGDLRRKQLDDGHCGARAVTDSGSAAYHGVEFRYPMMDRRLVEFALAVPLEYQLIRGIGRGLFRTAMQDILPESIQWRTDKQMPNPWVAGYFLQAIARIQSIVDELPRHGLVGSYVDVDALVQAWQSIREQWNEDGSIPEGNGPRVAGSLLNLTRVARMLDWLDRDTPRGENNS